MAWGEVVAVFQPEVMEPKAMIGPFQKFEFVALPMAKAKERRTTGIHVEGTLDQGRQTVNGFPQIGRPHR
jgi:hypothetical protein